MGAAGVGAGAGSTAGVISGGRAGVGASKGEEGEEAGDVDGLGTPRLDPFEPPEGTVCPLAAEEKRNGLASANDSSTGKRRRRGIGRARVINTSRLKRKCDPDIFRLRPIGLPPDAQRTDRSSSARKAAISSRMARSCSRVRDRSGA